MSVAFVEYGTSFVFIYWFPCPLTHLCEEVQSLGNLTWINNMLDAFWWNNGTRSRWYTEILLSQLWEVVQSLGHLPWMVTYWMHFGEINWDPVRIYLLISHLHICVKKFRVCVICRELITCCVHFGKILDPYSHLSTEVQLRHSIQGGLEILLVTSCYRNRDKLRPDGPLGLKADYAKYSEMVCYQWREFKKFEILGWTFLMRDMSRGTSTKTEAEWSRVLIFYRTDNVHVMTPQATQYWGLTWCEFHSSKRFDRSFASKLKQSHTIKS